MNLTSALDIRELSPVAGAEVRGVDLREPVTAEIREALRAAWRKHALLVFRGQDLSPDQTIHALRIFGELSPEGHGVDDDGVAYVSNVIEEGIAPNGALGFHLDNSFFPNPLRGLMLYALETPPPGAGGDTLFSNVRLAYQLLPAELKAKVDRLTVQHQARLDPRHPLSEHPLAFKHPDTGETVLFLSGRHVNYIMDITYAEHLKLLKELTTYIERPEVIVRHAWQPGDLVIWDNIILQHARTDFDPAYRRHLRRLLIA